MEEREGKEEGVAEDGGTTQKIEEWKERWSKEEEDESQETLTQWPEIMKGHRREDRKRGKRRT